MQNPQTRAVHPPQQVDSRPLAKLRVENRTSINILHYSCQSHYVYISLIDSAPPNYKKKKKKAVCMTSVSEN